MASLGQCGPLALGSASPFLFTSVRCQLAARIAAKQQPLRSRCPNRGLPTGSIRQRRCPPVAASDSQQSSELSRLEEEGGGSGVDDPVWAAEGINDAAASPPVHLTTRERLLQTVETIELEDGSILQVRALRDGEIGRTEGILTEAFSDAMGYLPAYRQYLGMQIGSYLKQHINLPPLAVVLVAVLVPPPEADSEQVQDEQPTSDALPSQDEVLEQSAGTCQSGEVVATLELSFNPATRSKYLTLDPPPVSDTARQCRLTPEAKECRCAYLMNMAVASEYRRKGLGTKLLLAAENFVQKANEHQVYLHVRLQDKDAFALYDNNGYEVLQKDTMLLSILGMNRRYLMRKTVRQLFSSEAPR